ncbi:aminotransferase class V-fold PLP-dependent enzyme [Phytohabitans rumicis]|uniref:Aminotransferase class V n=1 Tax=Phytohabitans rumicis TaxID=1076125 RepID=A0A6V8L4H9_9ACTN|nr:aminotransferase class V-fold PLP-dependent enzyme [Phytohabitans rumicis]GFJ89046.1 aminotransferase class V [Phytohabitans rumicis]
MALIEGVEVSWDRRHECFSLDPAVSYLNHGARGAVPVAAQRALQRLRDEAEANPIRFFRDLPERIAHTRRHLAAFLGADPDGAALVGNTTAGAAIVLQSLGLRPGDEVLLTDHRYGAVAFTAEREGRRTGASTRTVDVPLDATDDEVTARVADALRPGRTRLLVVDHIASATARLFPVEQVAAVARAAGVPVLVDGAHVPGMLPVRVDAIGADFWVGNLHKWAYAPRGTALLSVAPRWRDRIDPLAVSWEQDAGFPARVEWQGTLDYTPWLAAPTGLFALRTLGVDRVREHNAGLAAYGQRVVGAALGVAPGDLPGPGGALPAGVAMRIVPLPAGVAATVPDAEALEVRIADEVGAMVAVMAWDGRGWLRLCGQVYNRREEYDRLAERLPALLSGNSRTRPNPSSASGSR